MTETITIRDAKAHLGRLVREAAQGKTITITDHGLPSARIVAANSPDELTELHERIFDLECALTIARSEREQVLGIAPDTIPNDTAKAMLRAVAEGRQ